MEIDVLKDDIIHLETEKENIEKEAKAIINQKNQEIAEKDKLINNQQTKLDKF